MCWFNKSFLANTALDFIHLSSYFIHLYIHLSLQLQIVYLKEIIQTSITQNLTP